MPAPKIASSSCEERAFVLGSVGADYKHKEVCFHSSLEEVTGISWVKSAWFRITTSHFIHLMCLRISPWYDWLAVGSSFHGSGRALPGTRISRVFRLGLVTGLPVRPGSLPFPNRVWSPQPRSADVPIWLRHLVAGYVCTDR